jgi:hypothetical protein
VYLEPAFATLQQTRQDGQDRFFKGKVLVRFDTFVGESRKSDHY